METLGFKMANWTVLPRKRLLRPYFVVPGLGTEKGEAIFRLLVLAVLCAYFCAMRGNSNLGDLASTTVVLGGYALFGVVAFYCTVYGKLPPKIRLSFATVLDQALSAALFHFAGLAAAPILFAPICFALGAGLRHGRNYAVLASTTSALFAGIALVLSPYWAEHWLVGAGIYLGTWTIPLYIFRLTDQLNLALRTDYLTKLTNRMGFDELLDDLCATAETTPDRAALVYLDLDGFKAVNDGNNHAAGDRVLELVALELTREMQAFGTPARLGGDEFAIVVDKLGSRPLFEKALGSTLAAIRAIGQREGCKLGASVGVVYFDAQRTNTRMFVTSAADELLYLSKRSGKNQFSTSASRNFDEYGRLQEEVAVEGGSQHRRMGAVQ